MTLRPRRQGLALLAGQYCPQGEVLDGLGRGGGVSPEDFAAYFAFAVGTTCPEYLSKLPNSK
jgi:hypothetical protein